MVDRSVLVRLRADISDFQRKMVTAGTTTSVFVKNLETADSRMGNLVQTALALAPALVPISATAVPALAGLTSQAGFAAAGVGVLVAAFNGVGDALEAVNEYQLEPTAENFAKMREEMLKLPAEGRQFVRFIDSEVMPALDRLQDVAAAGALPGFEDGIDDLMARLPEVRDMVDSLADASGRLAEQTGEGLASEEFDEFFNFLRDEAEPTLLTFGRTIGNVFDGLTTTLIGLNPLANDFEEALLNWSRGFADIEPEDFATFVAYVRDVGPDAVDALTAVGGALVALVEAAAPVGAIALPVIEALANVITVVANSAAGPALIGAAAGLSAVSRAVAVFNAANGSAVLGLMRGAKADGNGAARGLSNFGKAAAGIAAVTVVFAVLDELNKRFDETLPGIEDLTGRLLDLEELGGRGFSVSLGKEFDSLGASIERIANPDVTDGVQGLFDAIAPGDNRAKSLREATAEIELLDQALAGIVASAGPEAAEKVLGALVEQGYLTEEQLNNLRGELGLYDEALSAAENQERLAADGADELGGSFDAAAERAQAFRDSLARLNDMLDGRANMRDYEAAIDDFTDAMKRNGRNWDINTEKGRENQAMLDGIVGSTLAVAEGMKGAARQRFLTSAIADLRTMADRFDIPRSQVRELIRELQEANRTNVNPTINADTGAALAKIQAVRNSIESLRDRNLTITTTYKVVRTAADAIPYRGEADGGVLDFYAVGGVREQHVAQIAPAGAWRVWAEPETGGEAYIPLAASKRERSIDIWEEVGSRLGVQFQRFADGGTAGERDRRRVGVMSASVSPEALRTLRHLEKFAESALAAAQQQQEAAELNFTAAEENRDNVKQLRDSLYSAVSQQFSNSLTGGGLAGLSRTLAKDITGGSAMATVLQALVNSGLDTTGAAAGLFQELASSDDYRTASQLLAAGPDAITFYEQQYATRASINASRGQFAADASYGMQLDVAEKALRVQQQQLEESQARAMEAERRHQRLSNQVEQLTQAVREQADQIGKVINGAATSGSRGNGGGSGVRRGWSQ